MSSTPGGELDEPLIVQIIHRYHPDWEAPEPTGRTWVKTLCPFHGDERASAAVSYELQSFKCQACNVKGNHITLIKQQEGVSHSTAERITADMAVGGGSEVPSQPAQKPRSRLFGEPRTHGPRSKPVRSGVRRRPFAGT